MHFFLVTKVSFGIYMQKTFVVETMLQNIITGAKLLHR